MEKTDFGLLSYHVTTMADEKHVKKSEHHTTAS